VTAELRGIERLLTSRIGLDPVAVGSPLILRAVTARMTELGLNDFRAYESRACSSDSELQALIEEVVVAESWFFRDERPFQSLQEHVRTRWLSNPTLPRLRVLSLACAGGEEPYSIAISLLDLGLPAQRFEIDAVDISNRRLAIARRGIYSLNAFRGVDDRFRTRYFRQHPQGYELTSTIRSTVRFQAANVVQPDLLAGSCAYDVLFCRNLLIYLSDSARAIVLAAIDRLLATDGLVIVGHADRLAATGICARFTAVGDPASFAYRRTIRSDAKVPSFPGGPFGRDLRPAASPLMHPVEAELSKPQIRNASSTRSDGATPEDRSVPVTSDSLALLDRAAALANLGQFSEAVEVCEQYLRQQGLSAQAYCLMGMICQAAGDQRRAEDCFQKTLYLDPTHDDALLALALLAERRGDLNAAANFRRRAERGVAKTRRQAN
jgi:chemotaxis protein methyltransferase WspC